MVFKNAKWIWNSFDFDENEYAEFYDKVEYNGGNVALNISVCGDYTLFINGKFAGSNQYGDFEHYKVYDKLDITKYLNQGKNHICILVWYFGKSGMRYFTPKPGLIYEVVCDENVVLSSSELTLSRKSKAYHSGGDIHKISAQLGYSYKYDSTKEDNWILGDLKDFSGSVVIQDKKEFYLRPIKKLRLKPLCRGKIIAKENDTYIVDIGREIVGLCTFSIICSSECNVKISYGESLKNGRVKRLIGGRDFSFDYVAKQGKNTYTNYMLRLGCRYLEVESKTPIEIEFIGIIPQIYPTQKGTMPDLEPLDKSIYQICVNALNLCMMEHYVDCPWREQGLYSFDSRNQMLAGFYAFGDKNLEYARSNIYLMSKDNRKDKLLSICYPSGEDLVIPAFSLYYIVAVNEYAVHSGDLEFLNIVFDKITHVLSAFVANSNDGLFKKFPGKSHWNYYDWSEYAEGRLFKDDNDNVDFMLNAIGVYALKAYDDICKKINRPNIYEGIDKTIVNKVREKFYNAQTNTFFMENADENPTELANSFAILSGIAVGEAAQKIAKKLANNELSPCSFSMKCFKYDALLMVDQNYKHNILDEIRVQYKKMLDAGDTTVWETANDEFDEAGSKCHGWSSIPIYYYHKFFT